MKAIWNEVILADSELTVVIEGNHYFPPESINRRFFTESSTHTRCGWKGIASYYTIKIEDDYNQDSAWYYPEPLDKARSIKNYVAFWKGIKVEE